VLQALRHARGDQEPSAAGMVREALIEPFNASR
jgi:hypothetical protein